MEDKKNRRNFKRKVMKVIGLLGFISSLSLIIACISIVCLYGYYRKQIPDIIDVNSYEPELKSKVYAANGALIAEFGSKKRILVKKEKIPKLLQQAFVASEDKNFFEHHGIDFLGIINAVFQKLSGKRDILRGASTITQQLAKSLLIKEMGYEKGTERSLERKVKEAILARRLEMRLKKEDILWMYLNEVYLGHGSYGISAAAQNYFRKMPQKLSLGQMAILAGLPQAPSRYSPKKNLKAALRRQSYVLGRLLEENYITKNMKQKAIKQNKHLKIYDRENNFREIAPYFSEHVRRLLLERFDKKTVYSGGLKVLTTLDIDREKKMQETLREGLMTIDKRQGFSGPIFSIQSEDEKTKAFALIKKINQENLFDLGSYYQLAQVITEDINLEAVKITTGEEEGFIPLAGMRWARERNPRKNYAYHKLRTVKEVLKPGDIILVRKRQLRELSRMVSYSKYKNLLNELYDTYQQQFENKDYYLFSLETEPMLEGAMVAIEPDTSYVQAFNGGYSFDRSQFNRVVQSCRQPGSVFKPVVYSAAIALKDFNPATMILDTPLTFRDVKNEYSWKPKNFAKNYRGEVTLRSALMKSMNVPTINVMRAVGTKNVLAWAKKLGIESKLKYELGTAIGSSCTAPIEISKVFLTIATLGKKASPIFIKEIKDRNNKRIFFAGKGGDPFIKKTDRIKSNITEFFDDSAQIMSKEDAYTMHYLMRQAALHGTARGTRVLNRPVAGKTGTTDDNYDLWFSGYTKNLLSLVWIGNDSMQMPLGVYEQGARTSLPLFNDFMSKSLTGLKKEEFLMPNSMCEARIDERTGLRINEEHPLSFIAPFKCDELPPLLENSAPRKSLEQMELMSGF